MEKEFIPYEQSLALKELGFDEPCFGYYHGLKFTVCELSFMFQNTNSHNETILSKTITPIITAPLYQQAFRWFRENYFIVSYIVPKNGKYTYYIISNNIKSEINGFKTYEEAELECLKKLIEIVKQDVL